jgi:transcriptional regulator with XRE-family HTH domain/general stress protein 26
MQNTTIDQAFAQRLRDMRLKKGMSQEALSFEAGLHRTYISQLERGLKVPSLLTLQKLSTVLGVSLENFMRAIEHGIPEPVYNEQLRLCAAIEATLAIPFVDDIEDFVWEAVFAYSRGLTLVDPLFNTRSKRLFDIVDTRNRIGWSAKTVQFSNLSAGAQFELVIQRADIFTKSKELGFDDLSLQSSPQTLGKALITHWHQKITSDADAQNIQDMRVCVLLKSTDRKNYAVVETPLALYSQADLDWHWTNSNKSGLQGIRRSDNMTVFRWYPSQKQLFERFIIPKDAYIFSLEPTRLPMENLILILQDLIHQQRNKQQ